MRKSVAEVPANEGMLLSSWGGKEYAWLLNASGSVTELGSIREGSASYKSESTTPVTYHQYLMEQKLLLGE